jgi:hypothetical protein
MTELGKAGNGARLPIGKKPQRTATLRHAKAEQTALEPRIFHWRLAEFTG